MVRQTPNHGFEVDHQRGDDWDTDPGREHLEERLRVRDAEANLGNYTPHAGATFVATNTGAVYDGDGTNWNLAPRELDSVTAGTTLRAQTVAQIDAQDLTAAGAPAPSRSDQYATHDGTGTPSAGLYRSDAANSQWVKVEDNTQTIAY